MVGTAGKGQSGLHVRGGGRTGPTLMLLHGLGATGRVWDGLARLVEERWPGRWFAPDLAGHGRSAHRPPYSFGRYAAEVAALLPDEPDAEVHVVGHSMGGVVALALASGWFGLAVRTAVAIGIKVSWTEEDVERASALAHRGVRSVADRSEAVDRYLRVSGLAGLVEPTDPIAFDGVTEDDAGWRLAQDPATFGVGVPDMTGLLAAARATVVLAAGEHDPISSMDSLRALQHGAVRLDGLGHNAHVEDPGAVWEFLEATTLGRSGGHAAEHAGPRAKRAD